MNSGSPGILEQHFGELDRAAHIAFSRLGLITRAFCLGGHEFVMRFAGEQLPALMTPALAHLAIEEPSQVNPFTLDCWELHATGLPFPLHPRYQYQNFKIDEGDLQIDYQEWMKLLNVSFPNRRRGFYCIEDAGNFRLQLLASPAHHLFHRWLDTLGWQFTHAAAVGTEQGGVLIAGYGGAGKSTLAFSTLNSSLRYLSDDYCVLVPGDPPRALALYSSGKLSGASFQFLPHLQAQSSNDDDPGREKAVFLLQEGFPDRQIPQLSLRAIVLPQIGGQRTFLEPCDRKEALRILVDSTFRQLSGGYIPGFIRMLRSIHKLPVYRLHLEADFTTAHQLLLELCRIVPPSP